MNISTDKQMFLGVPLSTKCGVADILACLGNKESQCFLISYINPHAWYVIKRNPAYLDNLNKLDFILVDGIGVIKALQWIEGIDSKRMTFDFASYATSVFEFCVKNKLEVALVGGKNSVAKTASHVLKNKFKGLMIQTCWSGYSCEPALAITEISKRKPDLVLCGMGAPRQEEFIIQLKQSGWTGTAITCGGFFDQLLIAENYYPDWIVRYELRVFYRIYKEPRRLIKRYGYEYMTFIKVAGKAWLKKSFSL